MQVKKYYSKKHIYTVVHSPATFTVGIKVCSSQIYHTCDSTCYYYYYYCSCCNYF